jgi:hypothetical protein
MKWNKQWSHGAIAVAAIPLAFIAVGCGHQGAGTSSGVEPAGQQAVAASASGPVAPPLGASEATPASGSEQVAAVANDSLPPDVAASILDTLVTPGTVIEVTATGSADVEEVLLADGMGRPQRFAYDPASDLWRAAYRVPIKGPERLGLSVTARSSIGRWRRVWVFANVQREPAKVAEPVVEEK